MPWQLDTVRALPQTPAATGSQPACRAQVRTDRCLLSVRFDPRCSGPLVYRHPPVQAVSGPESVIGAAGDMVSPPAGSGPGRAQMPPDSRLAGGAGGSEGAG